jgi:hypothetical protein
MDEETIADPEAAPADTAGDEAAAFEPLNLLAALRLAANTPPPPQKPDTLPLAST